MGCHTWFYKKVNPQPTEEDKIQQFLETARNLRKHIADGLSKGGFEYHTREDNWYPFKTREEVEQRLVDIDWMMQHASEYKKFKPDIFSSIRNEVGVDLFESVNHWFAPIDVDSMDEFYNKNEKYDYLTKCVNGIYYSNVRRYDDLFRYGKYGECLFSEEQMWKLIEDNKIEINDGVKDKLKEFWSLYPDGIIYFA